MAHLRSFELAAAWMVLCHNCAARAEKLKTTPRTVETLLAGLARERRTGVERRRGNDASWFVAAERRGSDRRASERNIVDVTELAAEDVEGVPPPTAPAPDRP